MKTKKILTAILAMIMVCAVLASCGGNSQETPAQSPASAPPAPAQPSTPAQQPPASNPGQNQPPENRGGDYDDDIELYLNAMSDFIAGTDLLMEGLDELMENANYISSEDDLELWCYLFIEIKEAIGNAADQLADIAHLAPEDYQESHIMVTFALAAIYDSMTGFEYAVDALFYGDEEAFYDGLGEFIGNLVAAAELWSEAVAY